METKKESYVKRERALFAKIDSRRMRRKFNNRHSIIKSNEQYWFVVFSNASDYEFKDRQEKWYLKVWIWDSFDHVILSEHILKGSSINDGYLTKIYNITFVKRFDPYFADGVFFVAGDSPRLMLFGLGAKEPILLDLYKAAHTLFVRKLYPDKSSDNRFLVIVDHNTLGRSSYIFNSLYIDSKNEIYLKGDSSYYNDNMKFIEIPNGYVIDTTSEFGTTHKVSIYLKGASDSYGTSINTESYEIKHKECNVSIEGENENLEIVITSPRIIVRTKPYLKE